MKTPCSLASVTRRDFLRSSAALAAAVTAPTILPSSVFGASAPSNRITLGIIGCGNQSTVDIPEWLKNHDCQIIAVCDLNQGSYGYMCQAINIGSPRELSALNRGKLA